MEHATCPWQWNRTSHACWMCLATWSASWAHCALYSSGFWAHSIPVIRPINPAGSVHCWGCQGHVGAPLTDLVEHLSSTLCTWSSCIQLAVLLTHRMQLVLIFLFLAAGGSPTPLGLHGWHLCASNSCLCYIPHSPCSRLWLGFKGLLINTHSDLSSRISENQRTQDM